MRHARTRLTALALLAALAASTRAAGLLHAHHAAVLHPGRGELRHGHADVERCPPEASGSPTTRLAEPGYVPKPAGPPQPPAATTRR